VDNKGNNTVIRVYGIKEESVVDGPGIRFVLFAQGCPIKCPGCHNPEAQDPRGGAEMQVAEVLEILEKKRGIHGVTFTGGEPFLQAYPLWLLGREIRSRGLDLIVFTGYTWESLLEESKPGHHHTFNLLESASVLVDGPYIEEKRDLSLPYRGSSNQRIIDVAASLKEGYPVTLASGEIVASA